MSNPYKVAMYMRISKGDLRQEESNSISNQRNLIYKYVKNSSDLFSESVEEYFDDGASGVNFERPQFNKMIAQLRNKSCNCVIVKDFSRLGRNYIEVSDYLEQIFPFLGVRFISVNDGFDSLHNEYDIRMDVSFKNLINDYYAKDLSQKIRTAFHSKMLNGTFVPPTAFFGYKIVKDNRRKLVVDEISSKIVKRIFQMIISDYSTTEIAQIFNVEDILTPNMYRKQSNIYNSCNDNFWRNYMVYEIVTDERYTGKGIFKKREQLEIASKKYKHMPKDKWLVIPNNHEGIISEDLYQKALYCLKYPKPKEKRDKKQRVLYAKVKCHCCGYFMKRTNQNEPMYYCETPKYITSPNCVNNRVSESQIEMTVISAIQAKMNIAIEEEKTKELIKKRLDKDKVDVAYKIKQMEISVDNFNNLKFKNYEDYTDGKISKTDFQIRKLEYDRKIEKLKVQIAEYKVVVDDKAESRGSEFYELIKNNEHISELSFELVEKLVEKIIIYDTKRFEIVWKFQDMFI